MGDDRYQVDFKVLIDLITTILKDERAKLVGTPKWDREEDPPLYDAIIKLRDYFERMNPFPGEELTFNIGSSYIRQVESALADPFRYKAFKHFATPEEAEALGLLDGRLKQALAAKGL